MQRIRFGRISAAVAALCLSGAIQHAEDICAMVNSVDTDGAAVLGEVRVNMEEFGVMVRQSTDRSGHAIDLTIRSTQRWGGVAYASTTMTLNGTDTT